MKRYLNWFWMAALSAVLAGCNLFIEEEDTIDELGFKNVPTHTGEGYDAPVTMQDGDATVTYQYKSNVRVLTPEVQQQWITTTDRGDTNGVILINYRGDTPSDVLPVPGEILVSTITEKFDWGCNHLVVSRKMEGGEWRVYTMFASLEDTYEELIMDGDVTTIEEETLYAVPDYTVADVDEDGYTITDSLGNGGKPATSRVTRSVASDILEQAKVTFNNDGFDLHMPLDLDYEFELDNGVKGEVNTNGTEATVNTTFNLNGFNVKKGNFKVEITQTVDFNLNAAISAGWSGNKRLVRVSPLKGKPVKIGYVVIVFFIDIDVIVEGEVRATFNVKKHIRHTDTYTIDFRKLNVTEKLNVKENLNQGNGLEAKKDDNVNEGPGLESVIIDGKLGVYLKVDLGMGFYGKLLASKISPKWGPEMSFAIPLYEDSGSERIYNIGEETGIDIKYPLSLTLCGFFDLSLRNYLETVRDLASGMEEILPGSPAKLAEKLLSATIDFYDDMVEDNALEYNPSKKSYTVKEEEVNLEDMEHPLQTTFGPWYPIEGSHFAWFPTMSKRSFKVVKAWNESLQELGFKGEFKCAGTGFLGVLGVKYVPALKIMEGSKLIDTVWPDEGGKSCDVKEGNTYHFSIKGTSQEGVTYTAVPCYYGRPLGMKQNPDALDKGIPFCATSPNISLIDVKPTRVDHNLMFADKTYYSYVFHIDLHVGLRGSQNVQKWGVEYAYGSSKSYIYSYDYNPKNDEKLADGTYKLKFNFEVEATEKNPYSIKLRFRPYYTAGSGTGGRQRGSEYVIKVYSDGYYRVYDPETDKAGDKVKFAPQRNSFGSEDYEAIEDFDLYDAIREGRVRVTVEGIERVSDSTAPQLII